MSAKDICRGSVPSPTKHALCRRAESNMKNNTSESKSPYNKTENYIYCRTSHCNPMESVSTVTLGISHYYVQPMRGTLKMCSKSLLNNIITHYAIWTLLVCH